MVMKEEGNYKLPAWSLDVRCTGKGWEQKHKPCYGMMTLEDGDVLKRISCEEVYYGCICPECKCFTEIPEKLIPREVKKYAPQVAAPGSDQYKDLTKEEKELSKYL